MTSRQTSWPPSVAPFGRRHQAGGAWFRQIEALWPSRWTARPVTKSRVKLKRTHLKPLTFKWVLFNFIRLFVAGLATLDKAARSHTNHISMPNLTQDLAPQPLLPLTPKRLSHSPSKNMPPGIPLSSQEGNVPNKRERDSGVGVNVEVARAHTQPPSPN